MRIVRGTVVVVGSIDRRDNDHNALQECKFNRDRACGDTPNLPEGKRSFNRYRGVAVDNGDIAAAALGGILRGASATRFGLAANAKKRSHRGVDQVTMPSRERFSVDLYSWGKHG
jgi:hypothetical protein